MNQGDCSRHILEIFRLEAGMLGNAGKHDGADLLPIVEGENQIRPSLPFQGLV